VPPSVKNSTVPPAKTTAGISKTAATLWLLGSTAVALTLLFPPFYCFFLAPVALVPFCVCILRRPMSKGFLLAYYGLGVAFFLPNLFWLAPVTSFGFIVLALFVALYFPLFAVVVRRLVVDLRLPATVAVPLVWTGLEYIRASFPLGGFPWFLLGNSFAPIPLLIQTADIFGVWGITFFIALLNGFFVDLLRLPLWEVSTGGGKRRFSPGIRWLGVTASLLAAGVILYGIFRLNQQTTRPGPRITVIQENIPQSLKDSGDLRIFDRHYVLTLSAAQEQPRPDLIVWPETMLPHFGNIEFLTAPNKAFDGFGDTEEERFNWQIRRQIARRNLEALAVIIDNTDVPMLVGVSSLVPRHNPSDSIKQNRTVLLAPRLGPVDYYSKIHLVPFGEFIPFRGVPVLGKLMLQLSPEPGLDYSLQSGDRWTRFALPTSAYRDAQMTHDAPKLHNPVYTFGTPICFEDTMPEPSRRMSAPQYHGGQKVDFLVNVSNDGWFHRVELDQHLQASQLRAVENRVAIARSVNTGNSGFIDSNGRVVKLVTDARGTSIGAVGYETWQVPIDSRTTIFSRIGDLFPIICGVVSTLLVGWTFVRPRRGMRASGAEPAA
jgi:apolipoprotein N-acyltransferase